MLNNVITLLSVILPSVVSILTICVPVLLNKQQNKMKELELVYQNKIQAFSEFSEKFTSLMVKGKTYEDDFYKFHTSAFKVMLFSSPKTSNAIEQLLNLIENNNYIVDTDDKDIKAKFTECLRLISEELNPDKQKDTVPTQKS